MSSKTPHQDGAGARVPNARQASATKSAGDEHRTSFTFIKPPTRPDRAVWEGKVQTKRRELESAQAKLKEIQEMLSSKVVDPERQEYYEKQKKATQRLHEVQAIIREEREKRANVSKAMRDVRSKREELEKKLQELTGQLGTFKTLDELEQALHFITLKMETEGTGSLKQEKEYIRRKKLLEAAKEQIAELKPLRESIEQCSDKELDSIKEAKELQKHLDELNSELRSVIQEKNSAVMPTSKVREEQAAARVQRDELRATLTKIRGELDALYEQRRKDMEAYQEKRDAWRVEVEEAKKAAAEAAKAQEEERARRQREREAERKLNPYAKEIDMCNTLIWYLEHEHQHRATRPVPAPRTVAAAPVSSLAAPGKLLKAEEEDSGWLFQDRRKKKNSNNSAAKSASAGAATTDAHRDKSALESAQANRSIKHDIHRLACFDQVGVRAPITTSAVADTITLLKEKLDHYRSFIAPAGTVVDSTEAQDPASPTEDTNKASEE